MEKSAGDSHKEGDGMTQTMPRHSGPHKFKERLLIVEDDVIYGKVLFEALQKMELDCIWVEDSKAAKQALEDQTFHAAVVDVYLTNDGSESGLELLSHLSGLGVPAVIMTSRADLSIAKQALNEGAFFLLEKPFQPTDLYEILCKAWSSTPNIHSVLNLYLDKSLLTATEKRVVYLVLKGFSNQEISNITKTSLKTIKTHLTHIYAKCEVGSRTELINDILGF